jgi:hypothetical protein
MFRVTCFPYSPPCTGLITRNTVGVSLEVLYNLDGSAELYTLIQGSDAPTNNVRCWPNNSSDYFRPTLTASIRTTLTESVCDPKIDNIPIWDLTVTEQPAGSWLGQYQCPEGLSTSKIVGHARLNSPSRLVVRLPAYLLPATYSRVT